MDGSEIAVLLAIIVVILLAVSAGRRRSRRDNGDEYPWWTLGLFAVGSREDEEVREARMDAQLAGEDAVDAPVPAGGDGTAGDGDDKRTGVD